MGKIYAPFASRDYDSEIYEKIVSSVPAWESANRLRLMVNNAVSGYIEKDLDWSVRMTEIRKK